MEKPFLESLSPPHSMSLELFDPRDAALPYGQLRVVVRSLEDDLIYWIDRTNPEEKSWLHAQIQDLCRAYLG
jgi:hypothetical protein